MIQGVISVLDAIAGNRLAAATRHGLCELVVIEGGTAPAKYGGGDSWNVVSIDTGGDWSYWRLTERIGESRDDRFQACHIITATFSLRLVTLVSRAVCDPAPDVARAAASDMRQASATVRSATNSSLVEIEVRGIDTDTSRVYASEFKGAGFGTVPPGKMLIAIDVVVRVTGTEECFGVCGDALDLTCALIQKASNAKVEECLGEERLNEICDTDCETLCEQLADPAVDVAAAVDCIPNGNIPEWTQVMIGQPEATAEVIVVGIEGAGKADAVKAILCDPCPECDPLEVTINGFAFSEVEDPCGATALVRVRDEDDNPVGSLDAPDWRIPSGTVTRDGSPFGTVLPGGSIDVPSDCPACDDATYQLKDSAANNIGAPGSIASGANANITAPDGSVQRQDSAGADIGSPIAVRSNQTGLVVTCPDGTVINKTPSPTYSLAVKSNGTEVLPQVRIAKRDGTTVDLDYLPTPTAVYTETVASYVTTEHTAGTTYNKPTAANYVGSWVVAVGAGGGGGAGARRGAGTQKNGGGGGGGGAIVWRFIPAASMPSSSLITIGAGGTGGAGQTVNNTFGVPGNVGGDTSFGALLIAKGGGAGSGGAFGASNGGTNGGLSSACTPAYGPNSLNGQQRSASPNGAGAAGLDGMNGSFACPSGGQGAATIGSDLAGGSGGGVYDNGSLTAGPAGGAAGANNGTNGADNVAKRLLLDLLNLTNGIGTAGSGGGGNNSGVGGNGGNGGNYGAGGGGGGSSFNGFISGAGGDGGGGLCIVMDQFA